MSERRKEVKEEIGEGNYRLVIDEIRNGRLLKQKVMKIGLAMDSQVNGVFQAKHLELDLADVMCSMMDKWWEVKLFREDVDGEDELYEILSDEDLGLLHLANRMRPGSR